MMNRWATWASALALLTACNDSVMMEAPRGFGARDDAGKEDGGGEASEDADSGSEEDAGKEDAEKEDAEKEDAGQPVQEDGQDGGEDAGEALPEGCIERPEFSGSDDFPTFAVHNSDYDSASISLLDAQGKVLDDSYLNAGTDISGLPDGLHGDVGLATTPAEPEVLTVVARFKGDYVLRVDLGTGEVLNRVRTQSDPFDMEDPTAAYSSNPQDYLYVNETTALVSRFAPNLDKKADALDRGDDLLVINPKSGKRVERIAFDAWNDTIEVDDGAGGSMEDTTYARPGSIVGLGCHAVVGTARLSLSYSGNDTGAVGLVDIPGRSVEMVTIPKLRNCAGVLPVSGDPERVLVECSGSPYGDEASAGLALLHVDADGEVEVEHTYRKKTEADPVLSASSVSLGGTRLLVKQTGDYAAMTGDTVYDLDIETGEYTEVLTTEGPGEIGSGAYDPGRRVVYLPDANRGVRVFEVKKASLAEQDTLEVDPALPPRTVRALRPL